MVRFFIDVVTIYLKPFRIKKRILYLLLFCLSGIKAQAQSLTTQVDSIVFSGKVEEREAILCAKYIQKYYHDTSLPLIYLNIRYRDKFKKDTIELANDNLYGDALDNDTYDRNSKYYQPGKGNNRP
jgi:hypothetical protein